MTLFSLIWISSWLLMTSVSIFMTLDGVTSLPRIKEKKIKKKKTNEIHTDAFITVKVVSLHDFIVYWWRTRKNLTDTRALSSFLCVLES